MQMLGSKMFKASLRRTVSALNVKHGFTKCIEPITISEAGDNRRKMITEDTMKTGNQISAIPSWVGTNYPCDHHRHPLAALRVTQKFVTLPSMPVHLKLSNALHFRSYGVDDFYAKFHKPEIGDDQSQRAVVTALWCNFLVFCLKFGVWLMTASHVMLAEAIHSVADFANQALLAYGLISSRRAPDDLHPLPPTNTFIAALVIGGSFLMEGTSLVVAVSAVRKGAASEGMSLWDYLWRGHDPTAVAVMMEDGAAVTGLIIAGVSLVAVNVSGNPVYDPIGSILVGNLLGMVVDAVYDCKSEVIGPGFFRFKAEIDFNGVALVQNYLLRTGRETWAKEVDATELSVALFS